MSDWNVDVDHDANRLFIDLNGHMGTDEAEQSTAAVVDAAEALESGFDVVTDLRDFMPGEEEAVDYIMQGKQAISENGAAAAVRVVGDAGNATGKMHFERVGEDEEGYPVAEAETVEQAETLLDKRRKQEA